MKKEILKKERSNEEKQKNVWERKNNTQEAPVY